MRYFYFIIASLLFACGGNKKTTNSAYPLNGTYSVVKQEIGGKGLPEASFQKQKLVMKDSNYVFTAESEDKGIVKYADGKMDIYGKVGVNAGKHLTAIYKVEPQGITICYNLKGTAYPTAFETKSDPMFFMTVFKKD